MRGIIYVVLYFIGYTLCLVAMLVVLHAVLHDQGPDLFTIVYLLIAAAVSVASAETIISRGGAYVDSN